MTHILLDDIELGVELGDTILPACSSVGETCNQRSGASLQHILKEVLVAVPGES